MRMRTRPWPRRSTSTRKRTRSAGTGTTFGNGPDLQGRGAPRHDEPGSAGPAQAGPWHRAQECLEHDRGGRRALVRRAGRTPAQRLPAGRRHVRRLAGTGQGRQEGRRGQEGRTAEACRRETRALAPGRTCASAGRSAVHWPRGSADAPAQGGERRCGRRQAPPISPRPPEREQAQQEEERFCVGREEEERAGLRPDGRRTGSCRSRSGRSVRRLRAGGSG